MPVEIGWMIPNRISYFRYVGDVTIEELTEASEIGLRLLRGASAPLVHTIQDSREMTSFPNKLGSVMKSVRESLTEPHMGWLLSVGIENDLVRFIATMVAKMTKLRHRIFVEMDDAYAFLQHVDTTLPQLSDIQLTQDVEILYRIGIAQSSHEPLSDE